MKYFSFCTEKDDFWNIDINRHLYGYHTMLANNYYHNTASEYLDKSLFKIFEENIIEENY
ncbi:MAG: hypothetical protein ACOCQD_05465 [archaeon]